jgi:hypothetical protein
MAYTFHSGLETGDTNEWSSVQGSPSVVEYTNLANNDTADSGDNLYGQIYQAQTFTTGSDAYTISSIHLYIDRSGSPNDLEVAIQGVDGSSHPDNSDLDMVVVPSSDIPTSTSWVKISGFNYRVSASTQYAIVCRQVSDGGDVSNDYGWRYQGSGDPYAGGARERTTNGGSSWTTYPTMDQGFRVVIAPNTGDYCLRCNTSSATAYVNTTETVTPRQVQFYLYIASLPGTDCMIVGDAGDNALYLTTTGELDLYDAGVKSQDGTTTLSTGQWYRITCAIDASLNAYVWIDGSVEHDGISTGESYWGASASDFSLGVLTSCTTDLYFDDLAINDSYASSALDDLGVVRSDPNGEGYHQDTGSGSKWQDPATNALTYDHLDTVPLATSDYGWCDADGAQNDYTATLENSSTIGLGGSDTIQAVNFVWYWECAGGGVGDYATLIRDGGGDTYDWTIDDPKDPTVLMDYHTQSPQSGSPTDWTQSNFDATEMGFATDDANKDVDGLYHISAMVLYTPAAAGTLEADVATSVTVTDNVDAGITPIPQSVADTITIAEDLTGHITADQSVADTVTVADDVTARIALNASVYDSVSIAESVVRNGQMYGDISDSVTIAEDLTGLLPVLYAGIFDTVTVDESVDRHGQLAQSVADAVSIAEAVLRDGQLGDVTVFDTVSITEDVTTTGQLGDVTVFDTVSIAEDVSRQGVLRVSVSDTISISEYAAGRGVLSAAVFSSIAITEAVSTTGQLAVTVWDSLTVAEDVATTGQLGDTTVFDSVTITEDVTRSLSAAGALSRLVFDSISITESVTTSGLLYADVFDSVTIAEAAAGLLPQLYADVSDTLTVSEDVSRHGQLIASVYDTIGITESAETHGQLRSTVFDSVAIAEAAAGVIPILYAAVADTLTVAEQVQTHGLMYAEVSDTVTIAEDVTRSLVTSGDLDALVYDSIAVAESLAGHIPALYAGVFSLVSVSDATDALIPALYASVSDDLTISESVARHGQLAVSVVSDVSVTESVATYSTLDVILSDSVTVTDATTAVLPALYADVFDSVTLADTVSGYLGLGVAVFDAVTVLDVPTVSPPFTFYQASVSDTIGVSDYVSVTMTLPTPDGGATLCADTAAILGDWAEIVVVKRRSLTYDGSGMAVSAWAQVDSFDGDWQPFKGDTGRGDAGLDIWGKGVVITPCGIDVEPGDQIIKPDGSVEYVKSVNRYEDHLTLLTKSTEGQQ